MTKRNLFYGQSGGPSAVINASAYGVINEALKHDEIKEIYALRNGINGVLTEQFVNVRELKNIELLLNTPGSSFGSVRYRLPSYKHDIETYKHIHEVFKKYNIGYFLYNGGNDSMDTCMKLSEYFETTDYDVKIIGIPKTIDNDLPLIDHSPGFGSAAKYIINTLMQVKVDSSCYLKGKVTIIEVMGRHAGWLSGAAYVANKFGFGADLIYIPERAFDLDDFIIKVNEIYKQNKNCLVVVSEGIKDKDGNFIGNLNKTTDAFGHKQLGGVANYLGDLVEEKLGLAYRAMELSTAQRAASFIRSKSDVSEAIKVGEIAVKEALKGNTNKMVGFTRLNKDNYELEYKLFDIDLIANKESIIPDTMINEDNTLNDKFIDYIMPLIEGEYHQEYEFGVQKFFKI